MYGKELILDMYDCDVGMFNRESIEEWLVKLCDLINMDRADLHFWDYEGYPEDKEEASPHIAGTSAIQFITTSNITIHTLDKLKECYINIFSCKDFDWGKAKNFCEHFFRAGTVERHIINRGLNSKYNMEM